MLTRSDQDEIRRQRRQQLIDRGVEPYPARTQRTHRIAKILDTWKDGQGVTIAGRVRAMRIQGGSAFLDIVDETGKIQIFAQVKNLGDAFADSLKHIDLGDFLDVTGTTFVTKRGERTIDANHITWLAKALRPLPSTHFGLEDVEQRYRHREVDLLVNPEAQPVFLTRAKIISAVRRFLTDHDFVEVETPILQPIQGGATARPFTTHHNALDSDLFLRVAPELYLKRLIVGGFNRVFEIGKNFRNEGIDHDHNPEFTEMECYAAYTDYEWMMNLTEDLFMTVAKAVFGKPEITVGKKTIKLKKPFRRIPYHEAILHMTKIDIDTASDEDIRKHGQKLKSDLTKEMNRVQMIDELFKTHVRPNFIEPGFIIDYPIELSPLAKKKPDNPKYTERFQLLGGGTELGNAFSELNDPIDQRERFEAQEQLRAKGDQEAQPVDENYLQALEYGMPPTSGLGIGIDRLTALLTNQKSLKEVIFFPTLKPEK